MKINVTTLDAQKAGNIELDPAIFGIEPHQEMLYRIVLWQLAKRRSGTHKVKTRGEITATGAKMAPQKGGGRARHGSRKPGLFRGGGRAFGPVVRDHAHKLPKKMRKLALKSALSVKQAAGQLAILDKAVLEEPKTARLAQNLSALGWKSVLIVGGAELDANFCRAAANLPHIDVLPSAGANVYDILRCETLVLTKDAVKNLEERLR